MPLSPDRPVVASIEEARRIGIAVYPRVWRTSLDQPGFAVVRLDPVTDSGSLRRFMLALIDGFGAAAGVRFAVERLGRFDQQVTTKFHRDGAPNASLLVLGYEPTTVRSRFTVADVASAAEAAGLGINAFIAAYNPMFPPGESKLTGHTVELTWPCDEPAVVVLNNSLFPGAESAGRPLGVMHKGEMLTPDPTARRVINSVGATPIGLGGFVPKTDEEDAAFVARDVLD